MFYYQALKKSALCLFREHKALSRAFFAFLFMSVISTPGLTATNITLGVYLPSIYDINSNNGTFSADVWIWSKAPKNFNYKLSEDLELSYLSSKHPTTYSGDSSYRLGDGFVYSQRKLSGTFLHNYDLKNFPFDRQTLQFFLEDNKRNNESLILDADQQSGYDRQILIDGWKIQSLRVGQEEKMYNTNFGNSDNDSAEKYSRVIVEIELKRDAFLIFFKVTLGLFAAVIVAVLSSAMRTDTNDLFSARVGLLGGTLLAVVVNQQFADAKSGDTTAVTLIDSLHMLGFSSVMILFVGTLISRYLSVNFPGTDRSSFGDRVLLVGVAGSFLMLSGWWTGAAILS